MYKEYGWTEKNVSSTEYIFPKLYHLLLKAKSRYVLDVGCGNGEIVNRLIAEGFCAYGIDASAEGILIGNKQNPGHFFEINIEDGIIPDSIAGITFDTVISTEVIEHIYSPQTYMKFISKILKGQDGTLIITTPYHGYLKNLLLAITGKFDKHFTALWEGGHIKFWSRRTLTKLLIQHQFIVTEFIGCGRIPYLWKSMMIKASKR